MTTKSVLGKFTQRENAKLATWRDALHGVNSLPIGADNNLLNRRTAIMACVLHERPMGTVEQERALDMLLNGKEDEFLAWAEWPDEKAGKRS